MTVHILYSWYYNALIISFLFSLSRLHQRLFKLERFCATQSTYILHISDPSHGTWPHLLWSIRYFPQLPPLHINHPLLRYNTMFLNFISSSFSVTLIDCCSRAYTYIDLKLKIQFKQVLMNRFTILTFKIFFFLQVHSFCRTLLHAVPPLQSRYQSPTYQS